MRAARGKDGRVCVCVCGHRQEGEGALAGMVLVFSAKRAPLCVLSTLEQKPRYSGPCFKSNKLLRRFRDDIWRYRRAKPGRGGSAAPLK